jgi:hypothetical protein
VSARLKRYQRVQHLADEGRIEAPLLSERKEYCPHASTEELLHDLREVQKRFPDKFITRRLYRSEGRYSDSTWDSKFGTFAEYRKQAGLELSRGQQSLERKIAKHASLDVYRGFEEVEITPWAGKYEAPQGGRYQRILVGSDFHDIEVDPFCMAVFVEACRRIQPEIIVLNGDVFDNYEFSRYDQDPRLCDLKRRFDFVREGIFRPIREACPDAQIDLVLGNHEHRILKHMADRTPYLKVVLSDFMGLTLADLLGLPKYKINLVSKWDLSAYKTTDIRKEAAKNFRVYHDCFLVTHDGTLGRYGMCGTSGHTHRPDFKTGANPVLGPTWWVNTGCMCKIDAEYYGSITGAQQSFMVAHIDTQEKTVVPEHIVFSDSHVVMGGILYRRGEYVVDAG